MALTMWVGRAIGLDVHRDFCVVAICEDGRVRSGARVPSTPEGVRTLGESLTSSLRTRPRRRFSSPCRRRASLTVVFPHPRSRAMSADERPRSTYWRSSQARSLSCGALGLIS